VSERVRERAISLQKESTLLSQFSYSTYLERPQYPMAGLHSCVSAWMRCATGASSLWGTGVLNLELRQLFTRGSVTLLTKGYINAVKSLGLTGIPELFDLVG
jgi:hypothetical protein